MDRSGTDGDISEAGGETGRSGVSGKPSRGASDVTRQRQHPAATKIEHCIQPFGENRGFAVRFSASGKGDASLDLRDRDNAQK